MKVVKIGRITIMIKEKEDLDPYTPIGYQDVVDILAGNRVIKLNSITKKEVENLKSALDSVITSDGTGIESNMFVDMLERIRNEVGEDMFREMMKEAASHFKLEEAEKKEEKSGG
jgi:hypothetical protein